jgi:transcriptional regulator with XRE-family HTH domain
MVGALLRERREAANLSQKDLAEKLDVSRRSVQLWEAGQIPQPRHRRALIEFFENGEVAA